MIKLKAEFFIQQGMPGYFVKVFIQKTYSAETIGIKEIEHIVSQLIGQLLIK